MVSKYNVYYSTNDVYCIYNLSSRKVLFVLQGIYNKLKLGDDHIDKSVYSTCIMYGIIVADDTNEYSQAMERYQINVESRRLNLVIFASTACNFKCSYCYEDFSPMLLNDEMIKRTLTFLDNQIENYSGLFVEWFGGEPLLASEKLICFSSKLKEICKRHKRSYVSSITTNGYYLSVELFFRLLKSGVVYYQVTIDGEKNTHDRLRSLKNGKGTYETIIKNITDIYYSVPKNSYFVFTIRNNIYTGNEEAGKKFVEFFCKNYSDDRRFNLYQYPICNWGGEKINTFKKNELINAEIIYDKNNKFSFSDLSESPGSKLCYAAKRNGLVLTPDNLIYKCSHYIQDIKCEFKSTNSVGQIDEDGALLINDNVLSEWLERKIDEDCINCLYIPYCLYNHCPLQPLRYHSICIKRVADEIENMMALYCQVKRDEET